MTRKEEFIRIAKEQSYYHYFKNLYYRYKRFKLLQTPDFAEQQYREIIHNTKNFKLIKPKAPPIGNIEINQNCNLNCIMCNRGTYHSPNIQMDINLFKKIIHYGKSQGQNTFGFFHLGEPLLNPQLEKYFEVLREEKVFTHLSTNGLLIERKINLLCDYSDVIRSIRFSIDGASKE